MRRRLTLALVSAVCLTALAAPASAQAPVVTVGEFFFKAERVRIEPGATVTWNFRGDITHNVTTRAGAPEGFASPTTDPGGSFSRTFTKPGTYEYLCTLHPSQMAGVVQVGPDKVRPVVTKAKAKRARKLKVSFSLSERATAKVRIVKASKPKKTIKSARITTARRGPRSVSISLKGLKPGRYKALIVATDVEKNASKTAQAAFSVPSA